MSKKKKSQVKKHNFVAKSQPAPVSTSDAHAPKDAAAPGPQQSTYTTFVDSAIHRDVLRSLALALGLALIELALWALFNHTAVGPTIYGMVHL